MDLIDQSDQHENWFEALTLWNEIANWTTYKTPDQKLRQQFKMMSVYLWNEKDWLREQYPLKTKIIEREIDRSKYMCVVGDLANTVKHRKITRNIRSEMRLMNQSGKITLGCGAARRMYYIDLGNGKHEEVFHVLRGALEEFSNLRLALLSGSI